MERASRRVGVHALLLELGVLDLVSGDYLKKKILRQIKMLNSEIFNLNSYVILIQPWTRSGQRQSSCRKGAAWQQWMPDGQEGGPCHQLQ